MAPDPREELFAALAHPLRRVILATILKSKVSLSPSELSVVLLAPLSTVSYHVRKLNDLGVIRLVDTQPARGSVEHFYEAADHVGATAWARETLADVSTPDLGRVERERERRE